MTLAGQYDGNVVLGLNRGKNNISNTIAAAKVGVSQMSNLLAIELGNEPECECIYVERPDEIVELTVRCIFRLGERRSTDHLRDIMDTRGRRSISKQLGYPGGKCPWEDEHYPGW